MAKYLIFAFSDCKDPKRLKEFNNWYDNMHMPDMLEIPGMIKASRWMSADKKENEIRTYLAMYEIESDDLDEFNKKMRERGMWTFKQGRFSELPVFDPDNVPRIYRQITAEKKPKSKAAKASTKTTAKKTAVKKATAKKPAAKKASDRGSAAKKKK
jgi:hypothetical protein